MLGKISMNTRRGESSAFLLEGVVMTAKPKSGINRGGGGAGGGGAGGGKGGGERAMVDEIVRMVQSKPNDIFYRIPDLRAALRERGMSDAEFDKQFDALWRKEAIYASRGIDLGTTTEQQMNDRFYDKATGLYFGTFTLQRGWTDKRVKPYKNR